MPHNLLSQIFKNAFRHAASQDAETAALLQQKQNSRRTFLKGVAVLGGGIALFPSLLNARDFSGNKNIVIVGAGIAGLNAAYQLKKLGLTATCLLYTSDAADE